MRHIRPLLLDGHHLGTCHPGIYHRSSRGPTLSMLLSIMTTSYQISLHLSQDDFYEGTHAIEQLQPLIVIQSYYHTFHHW